MFDLLLDSAAFEVTEKRDKIYALLSLAADRTAYPRTSYDPRMVDICKAFANSFVVARRGLDYIQYANVCKIDLPLPSWVPDLSVKDRDIIRFDLTY